MNNSSRKTGGSEQTSGLISGSRLRPQLQPDLRRARKVFQARTSNSGIFSAGRTLLHEFENAEVGGRTAPPFEEEFAEEIEEEELSFT
jgi:hypothetical protein